jgi:hypothetical protein
MRTSGIPRTPGSRTMGQKMGTSEIPRTLGSSSTEENENFWNSENSGLRHHGKKIEEN